jgi:hypothetical protein
MRYNKVKPPVPQDDRRGCLCWETNTYSRECCDGDYHSQGIGSITGSGLPDLDCSLITLTGFAVAQDGTVTTPSTDIGTITQTSPSSFSIVDVDTERTLTVTIEVPSGYNNLGQTIQCTTTATQVLTPTLSCNDITLSGFAVAEDGTITLPTTDIGTISSTSPASFSRVNVDTTQTLTVNITVPSGYYNVGDTLVCSTTAVQSASQTLSCGDITISGFAVDENGVITQPTIDIGTFTSSPASFATVSVDTLQTLTLDITVPAGYYNTGDVLVCTTTATQPAYNVLECSDISITGFSVYASGNYNENLVAVDIGTIDSMTPSSFGVVATETTRTLTVNITVPSGYSNAGQTISCTTTATQQAAFYFDPITASGDYLAVDVVSESSTNTYSFSIYANDPITNKTLALNLANELGAEIAGQGTTPNSGFIFNDKKVSFYDPNDNLLIAFEQGLSFNNFSYVTPDTLGQVPANPYGGNAASWTSYEMVFDASSGGLITATGSQANNNQAPEMIIDNGSKLGYYWIIEDV